MARLAAAAHSHSGLQVLHKLIACNPAAEVTWNPVARKMRQRADGVQVQTVIAAAPRFPHTATLDDGRVYAAHPQGRRSSKSRGTGANDDDVVHSPRLRLKSEPTGQDQLRIVQRRLRQRLE